MEGETTSDLRQEEYTRMVTAASLFQQQQNKTQNHLNIYQQGIR